MNTPWPCDISLSLSCHACEQFNTVILTAENPTPVCPDCGYRGPGPAVFLEPGTEVVHSDPFQEARLRVVRQNLALADTKLERLIGHRWRQTGPAAWTCENCAKQADTPTPARLDPCPQSEHEQLKRLVGLLHQVVLDKGHERRPVCPDCGEICVKTNIEMSENDGSAYWITAWVCECKYSPESQPAIAGNNPAPVPEPPKKG